MFAPTRYLAWAKQFYGKVPFDLASSGMPYATRADVGMPDDLDNLEGPDRLQAAIARYNQVPHAEALATLGTTHALWAAYTVLLAPGDEVLVEDPAYEPLVRIAEGLGARVVRFERPAGSRFALDPARVEAAMTVRTRVVAVSSLHNPTGARAEEGALRAIAKSCAGRGAHLLVDEVYAPMDGLTDGAGVWHGTARNLAPNVVCAASLTKCYGLGPHRVGWMLGPPDVVARAADAITATCGLLPVPHANFSVHAFGCIGELAARARRIVEGRRARVEAWLATRSDLDWSAPKEGVFGFATSRRAGDLLAILEEGVRRHGVLATAGSFFGVPNGFRLSWATLGGAELDEGLARLGRVLGEPA
jgi:aspartate/methionine/tyrosine aminotransferase